MHYVACGAGAPVVLLHGFPDFWYSWRHQLPALAAANLRCLAPDLRGYNETDKPGGVDQYRIETLTEDIAAFIRNVAGGSATVIGHDWGGVIAWGLAARQPELIRKLVIINAPHPARLRRELRTLRQSLRMWYAAAFQIPFLPELVLSSFHYSLLTRGAARAPEERERYEEALSQPGALTAALNYYRAAGRAMLRGRGQRLPRITAPTMVLWGEKDPALGIELLEGLEVYVQNLEIVRLEKGHWPHITGSEQVNRVLLRFI